MTKDKGRARFFRRFFASRTLAVNPIDSLEIIHVGQEDGASNDVIERRAGGFENRAHVLHDLRRLFLDGFADQLHLSRETDLSGHVHRVSNLNVAKSSDNGQYGRCFQRRIRVRRRRRRRRVP